MSFKESPYDQQIEALFAEQERLETEYKAKLKPIAERLYGLLAKRAAGNYGWVANKNK